MLAGAAIVAGAIALFAEVADDQAEEDGRSMDWSVLEAMREADAPGEPSGPAWITPMAKAVSALGSVPVLAGISATASGLFFLRGECSTGWRILGAFAGGLILSEALKAIYDRGRPPAEYRLVESDNEGFPSGHALVSTSLYVLLATLALGSIKQVRHRFETLSAALALSFGIGVSRIYLGVHWANDVIAGWSIGAAWAAFLRIGAKHHRQFALRA